MGDGTSALFFDDVAANQERNPSEWRTESFFTASPGFENTELDVMQITEAQLQDIGLAVVSRLLALNGRLK